MGYSQRIEQSVQWARGHREPVGYVFMMGQRPAGPMRSTRAEAWKDAVYAKEAFVDMELKTIFSGPFTWIAPVWP